MFKHISWSTIAMFIGVHIVSWGLTLQFAQASPNPSELSITNVIAHNATETTSDPGNLVGPYSNEHNQDSTKHSPQVPPGWLAIPFVLLLVMIASGPLLYPTFWHKHYPKISILLAGFVMGYYWYVLGNYIKPVEAIMEFIQFIALISALYMASGGILIKVNTTATPVANLCILLGGAILSNFIGTTGASMLLIRPYIRLNQNRVKAYHIVFFIFMVSNVGGLLTPIGDPPLFLGFLKGVPFLWTLEHNFAPWLLAIAMLSIVFFWIDSRNVNPAQERIPGPEGVNMIQLVGKHNFIWLLLIIATVFIDPNIFDWVPVISYHGHNFSFVREGLLFALGALSYRFASPKALQENSFSFGPIKEVTLLFIGIFGTMIPALALISAFAQSETGISLINPNTLYWGAGIFSSFLDNAPTYLNFLAASMASQGADIHQQADVYHYATGQGFLYSVIRLKAVTIAAVFFGAMTYIGNGPNFMVKSIAEQLGVRMPSFFGYVIYFAIPMLLPVVLVVWLLCFYFQVI